MLTTLTLKSPNEQVAKIHAKITEWWSYAGSNRRPPACKAGALPAEL